MSVRMKFTRSPRHLLWIAGIIWLGLAGNARADWDDGPGMGFTGDFLLSSDRAPCGVGVLPRGHFPPEIPVLQPFQGVKLVVRQDPNRLCYVFGRIAEAPTIRVRQGEDLYITLDNEITDPAALDKLVAPGKLDVPNPRVPATPGLYPVIPAMHHPATGATNLHLHGFAVPPTVPQDEVLKTCIDPATGPAHCGRREFTYHYRVSASMPAGLYWYHPHVHGEVQAQMLMGLSGAIVVEGPEDDARRAAGIEDRIFIVRQSADLDAQVPAPVATDATPAPRKTSAPHGPIDTAHELACSNKAATDELTLNGAVVKDGEVADADLAQIEIGTGRTQLWRILNAATDAFLDLALLDEDGKSVPVEIVARDGAPLIDDQGRDQPALSTTDSQTVPPSGRIEFLVKAPAPGRKLYLVSHAVDTGCAGDKVPERKLAYLTSTDSPAPLSPPVVTRGPMSDWVIASDTPPPPPPPNPFAGLLARKTDRARTILLAEYPHPGSDDLNDFYIVEKKPGAAMRPFEMDGPPAITVKAGTTEEWTVENWTNELHAFHIHQVHFRVLAVNGQPVADKPLLDVVTVPAAGPADVTTVGAVTPGRVRIKVSFPADLAGDIPFHCHLTDHEDAGMMAIIRVMPLSAGRPERSAGVSPAAGPARR
ncbi:MAG TPA: multicopper oxidase family protein [Aliidongia sp.]|nr:multicopper oxidase family protein [Aliidongia sp.]